MTPEETRTIKSAALADIREALPRYSQRLTDIDARLLLYACDVARTDIDIHNADEMLALRKFLRMLDTYPFDTEKVQRIYRAYESLKFSGLSGRQSYRLTPVQCFMYAATFGFMRSQDDWRRVVTEAVYFIPRKFSKTTMSAFVQFWFFFFEDANSEGYCVANSSDQAKILYRITYDLIHQLDQTEARIRFTNSELGWKVGQSREAKVTALSAGGKTKDGLFAQLVTADEYGSAGYVNDHSDMANLLQVVQGSMGPRREPLTVITTTAGRVDMGPFEVQFRNIQQQLSREVTIPLDGAPHPDPFDWNYTMALHPDPWEEDEASLQDPRVWRKVNPHIGITVQPDYYQTEWAKMLVDPERRREQVTKLFNVFQSDRVTQWIPSSAISRLQVQTTIDDLSADDGWIVFAADDFSDGNDLCGQSYLCYNTLTGQFFADLDAWISEDILATHPNAALYRRFVEDGWLRVSPGATIDSTLVTSRMMELAEHLTIVRIGYDPYDAQRFINDLRAWIFSQGINPDTIILPVRQTWANYNSSVQEMEYMVRANPPLIHFSPSPLWPWEFGNCYLDEDRMGNKKPIKKTATAKVDNVQALLSALILFDQVDGKENTTE